MTNKKKTKKGEKTDMVNNEVINATAACTIPLEQVDENGSFKCPKCSTTISPDDETDDAYEIIETKMVDDEISELIIECGTCGTIITLTGSELQ
jgi:predicted RNA-binding Zn-ribbon protein involved in translation (DUF1610 family)